MVVETGTAADYRVYICSSSASTAFLDRDVDRGNETETWCLSYHP
jgi:hypothetical protein